MAINSRLRSIINTGIVPGAVNGSQIGPNVTQPGNQVGGFQSAIPNAAQPFGSMFGPLNDRRKPVRPGIDGAPNIGLNQRSSVIGQNHFGNLNRRF